jgi:RecA-family ATPase
MVVTSPVELISQKLYKEMSPGNVHRCLRDTGRLAGGYQASGVITNIDVDRLGDLAQSIANNINWDEKDRVRDKWTSAVAFGNQEPIAWASLQNKGRSLDWNETVFHPDEEDESPNGEYKVLDHHWVEVEDLPEPDDKWVPIQHLVQYLATLFESEEHVGYVTDSWYNQDAGRYLPKRGNYDRTAGQLIQALNDCNGDIGSVIGDITEEVGAWIRFNPVDGKGVKDVNVTSLRFALVECDEIPPPQQYTLLKKLELPIAAMVHSGGKSVHAIVRVEADTMEEYRKRVDFLYEVCGKNGLRLDRQNRNPSRLSRMPGVMRKDKKQWLIDTNIGKRTWLEWEEWIIDLNDDLPDIEDLVIEDQEPEVAPELIEGLLREGHKMLLAGPSKAYKSFALIQLASAIAEGRPWMGWKTKPGRVLYVNLELDGKSCQHRFWAIYRYLGGVKTPGMIDVWNLRGFATRMDHLAPKLIRRAEKKSYKAIIIDPVYKVLTGDENSAEQMALFTNQFDKICTQLNTATIFCHHHSKGAQGQKQSQDRASGSGVFARDPDTIIDLIELEIDEDRRPVVVNRWECDAMQGYLDRVLQEGWQRLLSDGDIDVADKLFDWGVGQANRDDLAGVRLKARLDAQIATGWRMEATMREFPPLPTKTMFFRYPAHMLDSHGLLTGAKAEGEDPSWMRKPLPPEERKRRRQEYREERQKERQEELEIGIKSKFGDTISVEELAECMACTIKTVRNRIAQHPKYMIKKGLVVEINPEIDAPVAEPPF